MSVIDDLKKKVQSLNDQLRAAENSLHSAILEAHKLQAGITVVMYAGKEYLFTAPLRFWDAGKPWISGRVRKKDGTWGERQRHLYDDWAIKP